MFDQKKCPTFLFMVQPLLETEQSNERCRTARDAGPCVPPPPLCDQLIAALVATLRSSPIPICCKKTLSAGPSHPQRPPSVPPVRRSLHAVVITGARSGVTRPRSPAGSPATAGAAGGRCGGGGKMRGTGGAGEGAFPSLRRLGRVRFSTRWPMRGRGGGGGECREQGERGRGRSCPTQPRSVPLLSLILDLHDHDIVLNTLNILNLSNKNSSDSFTIVIKWRTITVALESGDFMSPLKKSKITLPERENSALTPTICRLLPATF